MRLPFGRRRGEGRAEASRIKEAARAYLPEGSSVVVNEILCPDPACPDLETVILVLREGGRTRAYKVRKPMAEVTEQDLRETFGSGTGAA